MWLRWCLTVLRVWLSFWMTLSFQKHQRHLSVYQLSSPSAPSHSNVVSEQTTKMWRAPWYKVDSTTATLSCIYHPPLIFTNFSAFRTHLHALSSASIDMIITPILAMLHWLPVKYCYCVHLKLAVITFNAFTTHTTWPNCWASTYLVEISGQAITNGYTYTYRVRHKK